MSFEVNSSQQISFNDSVFSLTAREKKALDKMTKIYSMKNKHPERQPQKAISSGCSFQRYFSSSLLLVIHKRLVLTPASCHSYHPVPDPASMRRSAPFAR